MYVLGIVGGVASGKSAVAHGFSKRGAIALDADQIGHQILHEPEVIAAFRQRWGDDVIGPDGQVVRREVARRVFGEDREAAAEREFLNSVSHPRIRERMRQQLEEARSRGMTLAVIDAALLYETGWDQLCDGVVFVDAPQEIRRQRALSRGWSAEQFAAREASQWPVETKRSWAKWVVDNAGPLPDIESQVERIWTEINARSP